MKVLLDIKDDRASQVMEVIRKMPYVKATKLTEEKALLINELHEAVVEMNLIRSGKKKARNAEDFLNEL